MAKRFLNNLPKIPENELPKDSCCMICHRGYDTDSLDVAVRLPCNHHVGLECIKIWLSPERDSKNSCPMCRRVFFRIIDEEEEEQYERHVLRRVQRPPRAGQVPSQRPAWYSCFVEAAAEQYQESLIRARAFIAKIRPGYFEVEEEGHARIAEAYVASIATALRTLDVREMMLYLKFGYEGDFPPLAGPITGPLNEEQLETLFRTLQSKGAFDIELHPFPNYHNLTDRQMWHLHREEGESYLTRDGGFWGLCLYDRLD